MAHGAVPAGGSNQSNEVSPLFIEAGGQSGEGGVSWNKYSACANEVHRKETSPDHCVGSKSVIGVNTFTKSNKLQICHTHHSV